MLWILRTGAPWCDLPAAFGPWQTVYGCFRRWTTAGLWLALLGAVSARLRDDEHLMIDSTAMRVHAHGTGPAGGQLAQAMGRSKASLSTTVHMACDALGYPLGFILTGANVSDFDQAKPLLRQWLTAGAHAIMDKGYDSDAIRAYVNQRGGAAVIACIQAGRKNLLLTSTSIASATASKISSRASKPSAVSLLATTNSSAPSPPCSLSHASSSGSNIEPSYFRNTP